VDVACFGVCTVVLTLMMIMHARQIMEFRLMHGDLTDGCMFEIEMARNLPPD
jgi:hypothetical protein